MMDEKHPEGSTSKQERRQSTTRYLKLNRLPTLQEVLDRRTRPPLDLFCLYIFLQRESAEDALDFWLDVQQHENMCKAYFKDLNKSERTIDEDWPEYATYARTHGSHFTPLLNFSEHPIVDVGDSPSRPRDSDPSYSADAAGMTSPTMMSHGRERRDTESHGPRSPVNAGGEFGRTPRNRPSEAPTTGTAGTDEGHRGAGSRLSIRGWSRNARQSKAPTIFQRDRAVQKDALVESAERIYLRYLLPGAEKEIYLPPSLRMPDFPETPAANANPSPLIPDLFHQQKHYIFRALEADAFPRFLRAKAFANLSPAGSFWRLVLGLFILWGGFVLGFSLIFLDRQPRAVRVWVLLPFLISTNLLIAAYYSLSPLLALFRQSETGAFRSMRVREGYVGRLIAMRALWIEAVCLALTAALTCIFVFVPGHRL